MQVFAEEFFDRFGMLLRQIIFTVTFALLTASLAIHWSFDFSNYVQYSSNPAEAATRFRTEPVFPLFVFALALFGISPTSSINAFIFLSASIIIFAVSAMACEGRKWRALSASGSVLLCYPFILFALIVPRQGLATGFSLLAFLYARRARKVINRGTLIFLVMSVLTHTATGVSSIFLVLLGHSPLRPRRVKVSRSRAIGFALLNFLIAFLLLVLIGVPDNLNIVFAEVFKYSHYVGGARETGHMRMLLFVLCVYIRVFLVDEGCSGLVGKSNDRTRALIILIAGIFLVAFFLVANDIARLTYVPGVLVIIEISRKIDRSLRRSIFPIAIRN